MKNLKDAEARERRDAAYMKWDEEFRQSFLRHPGYISVMPTRCPDIPITRCEKCYCNLSPQEIAALDISPEHPLQIVSCPRCHWKWIALYSTEPIRFLTKKECSV